MSSAPFAKYRQQDIYETEGQLIAIAGLLAPIAHGWRVTAQRDCAREFEARFPGRTVWSLTVETLVAFIEEQRAQQPGECEEHALVLADIARAEDAKDL